MAKTTDRLHEFYVRLLDDPEVPEDLQQRVFAHARATDDRKLLARLAAHAALSDELDEYFAASDDALLVTAWMSRPGRDPADVVARAAGEKRVTVLAAIAQVEALDEPTFRQLADADNPRVAKALLSNPAAPADVLAAAAVTVVRDLAAKIVAEKVDLWRLNRGRNIEPLNVAVVSAPDVGPAIIGATDQPALLRIGAASPTLSADAAALACQKALEYRPPQREDGLSYKNQGPREQAAVMIAALKGPGRDARVEAHAATLSRHLATLVDNRTAEQARSELDTARNGKGMSSTVRNRIERACQFDQLDAAARDLLVDEAVAAGPEAVVRLLATSPQATPQQTYRLVGATQTGSRGNVSLVLPWTSVDTLLATRRSDPEAFGAILAARPGSISTSVLSRCVDPSAALLAAIRTTAAADAPLHRNILESPLLTMRMLMDAHVVVLSQDLPAETRKLVTQLVSSTLGDNEACWKTFEGLLGTGFDGSVRMLLEVCEAFMPDEQVA